MNNQNYFKIYLTLAVSLIMIIASSCQKTAVDAPAPSDATSFKTMKVPAGFMFETVRNVGVQITTQDNSDAPAPNIRVNIYTDYPENGGQIVLSGVTDASGIFSSDYRFPLIYDSLVVGTTAIGFVNFQKFSVTSGHLDCKLGGKQGPALKDGETGFFKSTSSVFVPMGTYNSNGVPTYLTPTNDPVDAATLNDINATLPEYIASPTSHPQYFVSGLERNLVLEDACDVWVTFVHEGAGYRNVLGYYKYNTSNPPATPAAIDSIHIIFPNVSYSGSGGGLATGNRVYLGAFPPGTTIAWVLMADGFRNGTVTSGYGMLYSDNQLNPEAVAAKKQHTILLNDIGRGKFLLSFEDQRRDGSTDNDFNDAIFYVKANPITSLVTVNVPLPNYTQTDTDNDGISNNFDDYPNDPLRAFNNYFPSENSIGTLAFEDLWPAQGDYDFNDMVVDYNFNQITNGQNKVVEIKATIILRAMGAGYMNGFGIQIPIAYSLVSSVTGTDLQENLITLNGNGTESGQSKATIIAFDNGYKVLPFPGYPSIGVNTTPGATYVKPDTMNIHIMLTTPTTLSAVGQPPYNPFIFVNKVRSHEVHLPNHAPTDLADMSLLGTSQDNSNVAAGRYYVTKNNLSWGIDVAGPFDYPIEKAEVTQGFLKFIPWGESGGQSYYNWYQPLPAYRNTQLIYSH
ncbi:MAG: LruC domain-containing protein [Bacteroidetes bacterium]|nr:LruC domain-containing protein [Bacteroidota bacterium]